MKTLHLIGSLFSGKWQVPSGKTCARTFAILLSLVTCHLSLAFAAGPGTTTGELLKIPVGARAIGMGEAYTAEANDTSALAWNPAGMSYAEQKEATFMHSSLIEGVHYEHLAYMSPGEAYTFGGSMSYLGYGSIAGYSNDRGQPTGDVSAYSYILSGGVARRFKDTLSIGMTGSFVDQKLDDVNANTFAANLGAIYTLPSHPLQGNYKFGASVLNLGPGLKFINERAPLPMKIKFGASVSHIKEWPLTLTMDVTKPNDNVTYVGLGSEYWFKELIALRMGYAGSKDEGRGLRMGVGLKLRGILFDYAYGSFGDFGATHRIGISMRYGERTKQMNEGQRAILKEAKRSLKEGDDMAAIMQLETLLQKDPDNHVVLKQMIAAHENILKKELNEAVAKTNTDQEVPSPEEFALQDLVPGQEKMAKNPGQGGFNPDDPMNLEGLPDAKNLENMPGESIASPEASAIAPAISAPASPAAASTQSGGSSGFTSPAEPVSSVDTAPAASTGSGDGPMLNPADFQ